MYKVVTKQELVAHVNLFEFSAAEIAQKAKPGQFVIIRINEGGERIPLSLADANVERGTITVVCHEVGKSTIQLGQLKKGDHIMDLLGPLGKPSKIEKFGTVLCVGGGVMVAPLLFQAKAFHTAGNRVIGVVGARTEGHLILEKQMQVACDKLYVATDDGTKGHKGLDFLEDILSRKKINHATAMGPIAMLKKVSELTHSHNIPTIVSLIPLMVDGMGMCGACRVTVGEKTMFACVDGPDFDGHQVDFEELMIRLKMFTPQEKLAVVFQKEGETDH